MEVSNIANTPVVFSLSGKDYQVKRLNLMDLFASFEVDVKKQHMDNIVALAQKITDPKERIEFQRQAIKDVPRGKDLEEAVKNAMDGFEGGIKLLWLALSKCNKITLDEAKELIMDNTNSAAITNIMNYITGNDLEEKKTEVPQGATVIEVEKKTLT